MVGTRDVVLNGKKNRHGAFMTVDADKYDDIVSRSPFGSNTSGRYYVSVTVDGNRVALGRYLLGMDRDDDRVAHHIDHHPTNNTLANLKIYTKQENSRDRVKQQGRYSSDYSGVTFDKNSRKYIAKCNTGDEVQRYFRQGFLSEEEAAAHCDLMNIHQGHKVDLNFPDREEEYRAMPRPECLDKKKKEVYGVLAVPFRPGMYRAVVMEGRKGKAIPNSITDDFLKCQKSYDRYVVKNGYLHKHLNFPEDYPEYNYHDRGVYLECEPYEGEGGGVQVGNIKGATSPCLIDQDTFDAVKYCALTMRNEYVQCRIESRGLLLHRYVMNAKKGQIVDHKNGNRMDARRANLRFTTHLLNCQNHVKHKDSKTSDFNGVSSMTDLSGRVKWYSALKYKGKYIFSIYTTTEEGAARARDIFLLENPEFWQQKNYGDWTDDLIKEWKDKIEVLRPKRQGKKGKKYTGVMKQRGYWRFAIHCPSVTDDNDVIRYLTIASRSDKNDDKMVARCREIAIVTLPECYKPFVKRNLIRNFEDVDGATLDQWKKKYNYYGFEEPPTEEDEDSYIEDPGIVFA